MNNRLTTLRRFDGLTYFKIACQVIATYLMRRKKGGGLFVGSFLKRMKA
ncbi:hypothetical protein SBF1_8740002 [Candidatus Desulfosporosinus infrequens]|uniref:Uncharacterized protein n=1 Tax=Candidatus Desulfosporosinus infrequens TaxID=2043169 RepID=A0A2U3LVV7_9FIRM|nr:hypothetical protein SBF1_8740002 [Candidatus Desulfosporosinus infrequens]